MKAEDIKVKNLYICEKCGNVMVIRTFKVSNSSENPQYQKILQCVVCRYWKKFS
ncbi:MAG: hypothetical protein ACTSRH_11955 [Promethearchaeota archaeon]